jgi:site-specific DNA-methyltransferase (adenine-specific)
MEDGGFCYKDMIGWNKNRAAHRAQRVSVVFENRGNHAEAERWNGWKLGNLRPVFEPILWFTKPYKIGTTIADNMIKHCVGGYNEDAYMTMIGRSDNMVSIGFSPGESGHHPNQKPLLLMKLLIELTTKTGQTILDPYCGSGSTLVAAKLCGRASIGIDNNLNYINIAKQRLDNAVIQENLFQQNVG